MSLELVSPPAVEPLLLADLQDHLRVTDPAEDALISEWIVAARLYAERVLKRALITQTWRWRFASFPNKHCSWRECWSHRFIEIPLAPVQSIVGITYLDESEIVQSFTEFNSDLNAEPALIFADEFPTGVADRPDAVTVEFVAGYGTVGTDVPELIRSAIKLYVGDLFENRESFSGQPPAAVNDILARYRFRREYA